MLILDVGLASNFCCICRIGLIEKGGIISKGYSVDIHRNYSPGGCRIGAVIDIIFHC